jgi:hypothetical protein
MRFIIICILILLSGCSWQSSQYNLLQSLIKNQTTGPLPNWTMTWIDIDYKFYAINDNSYIFFVNSEDQFIEFDGWQITKVKGFLLGGKLFEINYKDNNMQFLEDGIVASESKCSIWEKSSKINNNFIYYNQICTFLDDGDSFINTIIINHLNEIIGLNYQINKSYPPIKVRMNDYDNQRLIF